MPRINWSQVLRKMLPSSAAITTGLEIYRRSAEMRDTAMKNDQDKDITIINNNIIINSAYIHKPEVTQNISSNHGENKDPNPPQPHPPNTGCKSTEE